MANPLELRHGHSDVYTPAGAVCIYADAVIVSVVPLLKTRPEKPARTVYDLVAELERLFRVVQ